MTTVGVIGLGAIGRGIACGALAKGLNLVVCDIDPNATAPFSGTAHIAFDPVEVGARADTTLVAVVNDAQVLHVTSRDFGVLATAQPGAAIVILSTVSVATVRQVAEQARRLDVDVLDCGVSGGPAAAAEGALVSMVGGEPSVLEHQRKVLESFSTLVVHMGPLGAGLQAKLARNLVQYGSWLAAYEGQRLAEAAGIDLKKLATVIKASDKRIGGSSTLMFRDTVAPWSRDDDASLVNAMRGASLLARKDLRAALELGDELGIALPLADMTEQRCDAIFGVGPDTATSSDPPPAGA